MILRNRQPIIRLMIVLILSGTVAYRYVLQDSQVAPQNAYPISTKSESHTKTTQKPAPKQLLNGRALSHTVLQANIEEQVQRARTPAKAILNQALDVIGLALQETERFHELDACMQTGGGCESLRSAAVEAAIIWPLQDDLFNDRFGLDRVEQAIGGEVLHEALSRQVEDAYREHNNTDERIIALALLNSRQSTDLRPLEPIVFRDLSTYSSAEIALLLKHYQRAPSYEGIAASAIWELAVNPEVDGKIRIDAASALGTAGLADQFAQAVMLLDDEQLLTPSVVQATITSALTACALECTHVLADLARTNNPTLRLAALSAAARLAPSGHTRALARILAEFSDTTRLTSEEQDQLDYLTLIAQH